VRGYATHVLDRPYFRFDMAAADACMTAADACMTAADAAMVGGHMVIAHHLLDGGT
jgi:hypothetical protein